METDKHVPLWIAGYVLITGLTFLVLPLARTPLMVVESPGGMGILTGLGLALSITGGAYVYLAWNDRLKSKGIDIKDVRKKALDRISDETYLARVAKEDPVTEIREKALQRLEEVVENTESSKP